MINNFDEFPEYFKIFLNKFWGKEHNFEESVNGKVPFLDGKSIIDTINEKNGEIILVNYFNEIAGLNGAPLAIKFDNTLRTYTVLEYDKMIYPAK